MLAASDSVKAVRAPEGRCVLFCADTGATTTLNATAAAVWPHAAQGLDPAEIASRMASEYAVSRAVARADTQRLLLRLRRKGFLQPAGPGARPGPPAMCGAIGDGPLGVDISLTGACNAACSYCAYEPQMRTRRDLPTPQWLRFFAELGRLPTRNVCLSGGEVFLRPDLWELLDALVEQRLRYSILTNGSRVDEAAVRRLTQGRRRVRLESIQVSLDGWCAAVHERTRGKGTFGPAVRALRLLREAGLPVTCRVTVNRHNVADLERTARFLLETIGLRTFGTNEATPQGRGRQNQAGLALLPGQRLHAMRTLTALSRRYPGRVVATAGPLAQARAFAAIRRARKTGSSPVPGAGRLTACGSVFTRLAVLHDGTVVPCALLPGMPLGRINHDGISRIWKTHSRLRALRERWAIPLTSVPGCEHCAWAGVCNGGCPALAYELTGDINRADPLDCYRTFLQQTRHAD